MYKAKNAFPFGGNIVQIIRLRQRTMNRGAEAVEGTAGRIGCSVEFKSGIHSLFGDNQIQLILISILV